MPLVASPLAPRFSDPVSGTRGLTSEGRMWPLGPGAAKKGAPPVTWTGPPIARVLVSALARSLARAIAGTMAAAGFGWHV